MSRRIDDASDVAAQFGLNGAQLAGQRAGTLPFAIHNRLTGREVFRPDDFSVRAFSAGGEEFYWLNPPDKARAWDAVALRGHRLVEFSHERMETLQAAVEVIASHPGAMALVRRFITTFAVVEQIDDGSEERQLTSCSLPDLPLVAFISEFAGFHIPPLTLSAEPSSRHMAENIYHESVHQYVNYRLLTEDLFVPEYDSRSSPRILIPWRGSSAERNRAWELDRALHAAAVYVQLLQWRYDELRSGLLSDHEAAAIEEASRAAVEASLFLAGALTQHLDCFTPVGALFLGRLTQAAEQRARDVSGLLAAAGVSPVESDRTRG